MNALLTICVIWLPGVALAEMAIRAGSKVRCPAFAIGAGYFIGAFLAAISVPLAHVMFADISTSHLLTCYVFLFVCGGIAILVVSRAGRQWMNHECGDERPKDHPRSAWLVILAATTWVGWRVWLLFGEARGKPLLAWDGWELWAAKAKVWTMTGELVPFSLPVAIGRIPVPEGFFASTKHPDLLPWLMTYFSTVSGGWTEVELSFLYIALVIALCLSTFGCVKMLTQSYASAALTAAAITTLPYLNAQTALPGYADIWVAGYFSLGAMAAMLASQKNLDGLSFCVLVISIAACLLLKSTGMLWAGILLAGIAVGFYPRLRFLVYAGLAIAVLFIVFRAPGEIWLPLKMRPWSLEFTDVTIPLAKQLFTFRDWNILWWLVGLTAVIRVATSAWENKPYALDVMIVIAIAVLITGFYYSSLSFWVTEYTGVNRGLFPLALLGLLWVAVSLGQISRGPIREG